MPNQGQNKTTEAKIKRNEGGRTHIVGGGGDVSVFRGYVQRIRSRKTKDKLGIAV